MRVLITGATGFVGQSLIPSLIFKCPAIEIMTSNIDLKDAEEKYPMSKYPTCVHIHSSNMGAIVSFNPEITLHLATLSSPRDDTEIIRPMLQSNIEYGVLLLDALSKCSAMKLFGNTGTFAEFRPGDDCFESA